MKDRRHTYRLHRKLFFPLIGLLWLIIGISIAYSVTHERNRLLVNLENRLLNVNNTVIDAYSRGVDLQKTVEFIRLFTGNTTLEPLRITVYNDRGEMIADNPEATIELRDSLGNIRPEMRQLWESPTNASVHNIMYGDNKTMICSLTSDNGLIHSFAALPYRGEVMDFLSTDPMVWVVIIILGLISSVIAYIGVRTVCRNVYALSDFAHAISTDSLPDDVDRWHFSNDELGAVSRNLLTLYRDKIHAEKEKMHHERQIGMNVSHELKTPVGIIKGYLDSVLDDPGMPEETKQRFLERARQNTDRLADLIGDVSMVMRLQEGGTPLKLTRLNFHDLVERFAEDIAHGHIIADTMEFVYDIPRDCFVRGHESLLTNALLNLVYNAAQYSEGSLITLNHLSLQDGMHSFSFTDNGVGVDSEHIDRLFDLFYRVDSGRARKNGGSGLGLPLVHRIIAAMGGDIAVANAPAGGLSFTFRLPSA